MTIISIAKYLKRKIKHFMRLLKKFIVVAEKDETMIIYLNPLLFNFLLLLLLLFLLWFFFFSLNNKFTNKLSLK